MEELFTRSLYEEQSAFARITDIYAVPLIPSSVVWIKQDRQNGGSIIVRLADYGPVVISFHDNRTLYCKAEAWLKSLPFLWDLPGGIAGRQIPIQAGGRQ